MFTKVLVPVDVLEPDYALHAIAAVEAPIRAAGGEMRLIYVSTMLTPMAGEFLPPSFDEEARAEALKKLNEFAARLSLGAGKVTTCLRTGGIYHEILDEAKSFGADLIVIGSHRPSMATYLLGSNAAGVVRHAHCSVLVVR